MRSSVLSPPPPQCPIKISDGGEKKRKKEEESIARNLSAVKTSISKMKHNVDTSHSALLFFTARTKAEMFQFRIWTINQTGSLGKLLLSTEKSYLDTYGDETHLPPSEAFIKAFLCTCAIFSPPHNISRQVGRGKNSLQPGN